MATEDAEASDSGTLPEGEGPGDEPGSGGDTASGDGAAVGEYTWREFMAEFGHESEVDRLYEAARPDEDESSGGGIGGLRGKSTDQDVGPVVPHGEDWETVEFDPSEYLGVHPDDLPGTIAEDAGPSFRWLEDHFEDFCDPATTPVTKDVWMWEHFKREYYYESDGSRPRDGDGEIVRFDAGEHLGFDAEKVEGVLSNAGNIAEAIEDVVEERTVKVNPEVDEDDFFTTVEGYTTVSNRYDLEKDVPLAKKQHFREVNRYWVNKPYAFIIVFHSEKENEKKYYVIEPYQNEIEQDLQDFLTGKLRTAIKYSDDEIVVKGAEEDKADVIERETRRLLSRYDLEGPPRKNLAAVGSAVETEPGLVGKLKAAIGMGDGAEPAGSTTAEDDESGEEHDAGERPVEAETETAVDTVEADGADDAGTDDGGFMATLAGLFGMGDDEDSADDAAAGSDPDDRSDADDESLTPGEVDFMDQLRIMLGMEDPPTREGGQLEGIEVRPEPVVLAEDPDQINEYQVEKLLYYLKRNFIGYERIDAVKHDINVEEVQVDGYNSPVFVNHSDYEQIISNIYHGEDSLDQFVVKLAQRSGKGISKRRPQVDAALPDGSRSQLTLGREVSDHGTNYTIRQFMEVPHTPIDLINWNTFSLDQMAFLWLCIENHKSLIFAGGTASGKTTSLNAVSLFIPSSSKIVSIEDTREVELPQRNWIASITRPSFGEDDAGDVDEFDLLEAALRQRPDYIVMGEVRGEEGRTLFQVMSTGHTTYTTFHADSVGEVLKRFTTDPINVSKTMFTALDLVSIQTQTRVQGRKVRRSKEITEINHYDTENDEINVKDVYQWQAETDEFLKMADSNTLDEITFDRGWSHDRLQDELFKREIILAYLIQNGLNTYSQVGATLQAFINDNDTVLTLIAKDRLEASLEDLREMESVDINVDPEKEALVPRPEPPEEIANLCQDILDRASEGILEEYKDREIEGLASALDEVEPEPDIEAGPGEGSLEIPEEDEEIVFSGELSEDEFGDEEFDDDFGIDEADDEFDFEEAQAAVAAEEGNTAGGAEATDGLADADGDLFDDEDIAAGTGESAGADAEPSPLETDSGPGDGAEAAASDGLLAEDAAGQEATASDADRFDDQETADPSTESAAASTDADDGDQAIEQAAADVVSSSDVAEGSTPGGVPDDTAETPTESEPTAASSKSESTDTGMETDPAMDTDTSMETDPAMDTDPSMDTDTAMETDAAETPADQGMGSADTGETAADAAGDETPGHHEPTDIDTDEVFGDDSMEWLDEEETAGQSQPEGAGEAVTRADTDQGDDATRRIEDEISFGFEGEGEQAADEESTTDDGFDWGDGRSDAADEPLDPDAIEPIDDADEGGFAFGESEPAAEEGPADESSTDDSGFGDDTGGFEFASEPEQADSSAISGDDDVTDAGGDGALGDSEDDGGDGTLGDTEDDGGFEFGTEPAEGEDSDEGDARAFGNGGEDGFGEFEEATVEDEEEADE